PCTMSQENAQELFFAALSFHGLAEQLADHSLFDVTTAGFATFNIRNIVPGPFLKFRFLNAHSVALFSATLIPRAFQLDLLGLPEDTRWLDGESPFSAEQLDVHVVRHISTRYQH